MSPESKENLYIHNERQKLIWIYRLPIVFLRRSVDKILMRSFIYLSNLWLLKTGFQCWGADVTEYLSTLLHCILQNQYRKFISDCLCTVTHLTTYSAFDLQQWYEDKQTNRISVGLFASGAFSLYRQTRTKRRWGQVRVWGTRGK